MKQEDRTLAGIRYDGEVVDVSYELERPNGTETIEVKSTETPKESFIKALQALAPHVARLLEMDNAFGEDMAIRGVRITTKNDARYFTIHAVRPLTAAPRPWNIHTPLMMMPDENHDGSMTGVVDDAAADAVDELIEQTYAFLDGDRPQKKLPFPEPEPEAPQPRKKKGKKKTSEEAEG